jgi:hypothetical protein
MDVVFGYLQDPSQRLKGVRIHEYPSPGVTVCRCGTRIGEREIMVRVQNLPDPAAQMFRDQGFCSVRCLRAYCLESLEALDAMDTPEARAIVSDIHALHQAVAVTFAEILAKT